MPHKQLKRGSRWPWILVGTISALGVLLVGATAVVGCLSYFHRTTGLQRTAVVTPAPPPPAQPQPQAGDHQPPGLIAEKPRLALAQPRPQESDHEPLPAPPPQPSGMAGREWRKQASQRKQPPQEPRRHSTDDLIAAVDAAFAAPADELKPAMVFFPVADGAGKVRADGYVLGQMAAFAADYTPHHRLALSTPAERDEILAAQCNKTGTTIDSEKIALCTAALDTKLYVLPRLEKNGDGSHELSLEFHGDGKAYPNRTFRHKIAADELRSTPGLIARDVLDAVGVKLDAAELQNVLTPTVRNDGELAYVDQVLSIYPGTAAEDAWLANFLAVNSRCTLGWELYLMQGHDAEPSEMLKRLAAAQTSCNRLQIDAARLLRVSGRAEEALLALLKLAPSHRGDSGYHATLTQCAVALGEERLANHLFDVWEKIGPGYEGYVARGAMLIDWGWEARGEGWANTVTETGRKLFQERLLRAKDELEQAVKDDPTGYRAHVNLMRMARGLGLPRECMEEHFQKAVQLQPHLLLPYNEKWEYLRPRWHGDLEAMAAFGKECLDTGDWDDDIPQLCLAAINEVCAELPDASLVAAMKAGPLWDLVQAYDEAAEKHAQPAVQDVARNVYARFGVIAGHFEEVVPAFLELHPKNMPDMTVFTDRAEYEYFRDLVHARTGKLRTRYGNKLEDRALAQASVALATGDLDDAEKALGQVNVADASARLLARYRAALALGRKLKADGAVALTPQQIKDICIPELEELWTVEGDKLTGRKLPGLFNLQFPLGLRNAVLKGVISWEGGVGEIEIQLHTRSPRRKKRIIYSATEGRIGLLSDARVLTNAPLQPGPQQFRFDLGTDVERLEPAAGVRWALPGDDLPGGFAMTLWPRANDATLTISDLRIELKK